MDQANVNKTEAAFDALISLLKSSMAAEGSPAFTHVVLYTSFGVVRGRTGLTLAQSLGKQEVSSITQQVIELLEVTVEHYSNHLPTASFDRLYVRLTDIRGFALLGSQVQG
jgi:hypothetical protein